MSELERLREFERATVEAEARCCPEDYGFEEWIGILTKRLDGPNSGQDAKDAARYRYLCREAIIEHDGPDGMGWEGLKITDFFSERGMNLHELESDTAMLDALIDKRLSATGDRHE